MTFEALTPEQREHATAFANGISRFCYCTPATVNYMLSKNPQMLALAVQYPIPTVETGPEDPEDSQPQE